MSETKKTDGRRLEEILINRLREDRPEGFYLPAQWISLEADLLTWAERQCARQLEACCKLGYRAALEAVKKELDDCYGHEQLSISHLMADILARIAKLEKEHGG